MKKVLVAIASAAFLCSFGALKDAAGNAVTAETPFGDVDGETGTVGDLVRAGGAAEYVDAKVADATNGLLRTEKDPAFSVWTNGMDVAAGRNARADGTCATALGNSSTVVKKYGVAVGAAASVQGDYAIVLGTYSVASGEYDTALGQRVKLNGPYGAAVGAYSSVIGSYGVALGPYSYASAFSTALGYNSYAPYKAFGTTYDPAHFYFTSSNDTKTVSKRGATKKSLQAYLDERVATNAIAKVATSGAYADLTGKPTIPTVPTKVGEFENDAGYVTETVTNGLASSASVASTVTNAVREVVRETGDLLWDEELQVTWKATFEGGNLWYAPVTNVNITGRGE